MEDLLGNGSMVVTNASEVLKNLFRGEIWKSSEAEASEADTRVNVLLPTEKRMTVAQFLSEEFPAYYDTEQRVPLHNNPRVFYRPLKELHANISSSMMSVLPQFDNPRFSITPEQQLDAALLSLTPALAGIPLRRRVAAWHSVLYGRQYMFLIPPYTATGPAQQPLSQWIEGTMGKLPVPPLQCVLQPGDVLFVPQGWATGELSLQQTVSLIFELGHDMVLPQVISPSSFTIEEEVDTSDTRRTA